INRFSLQIEYDRVYIDFDDTITLKKKVNPIMMMFLYQCLNKDRKIILITKHSNHIIETLDKLKINNDIFYQIIHITKSDEKYYYLKDIKSSIFIDDSYVERKRVKEICQIPVFDIDTIECLIDWRY